MKAFQPSTVKAFRVTLKRFPGIAVYVAASTREQARWRVVRVGMRISPKVSLFSSMAQEFPEHNEEARLRAELSCQAWDWCEIIGWSRGDGNELDLSLLGLCRAMASVSQPTE